MRTTLSLLLVLVMVGSLPRVSLVYGQSLTGSLIGTVKDPQGSVVPRAVGTLTSSALIGRTETSITNQQGQLRFPALPPGQYTLTVEVPGFAPYREEALRIGIGATIERTVMLSPAAIRESVAVESAGSRLDARGSGFETRFGPDDLRAIPTRRFSMFDFIRAAPATHDAAHGQRRGSLDRSGARRLSSQTLVDLGISRTVPLGGTRRIELLMDVLNLLNDAAAEALATDNFFSPNFGQPSAFVDPRRAMLGVRLNPGQ